jgi:hypothetical protein
MDTLKSPPGTDDGLAAELDMLIEQGYVMTELRPDGQVGYGLTSLGRAMAEHPCVTGIDDIAYPGVHEHQIRDEARELAVRRNAANQPGDVLPLFRKGS